MPVGPGSGSSPCVLENEILEALSRLRSHFSLPQFFGQTVRAAGVADCGDGDRIVIGWDAELAASLFDVEAGHLMHG